jgi:hypothetical protein
MWQLHAGLDGFNVDWQIGGSAAAFLQGIPFQVQDVDIFTDARSAYAVQAQFQRFTVRAVRLSSAGRLRSHFGILQLCGVPVEIIGNLQIRSADGRWSDPFPAPGDKHYALLGNIALPVASLAATLRLYTALGKTDHANRIARSVGLSEPGA